MANIYPFQALRYDPEKVALDAVVTQPYDKINPETQARYYAADPHNFVRVILGKSQAGDSEQANVYTRAAAALQQWQAEHVLARDAAPSIYLYTQTFKVPGDLSGATSERRGFIALGQVEDYDQKVVFRHEQTLSKPKADRLNLLRATHAHCEQIFMVYSDPANEIDLAMKPSGSPTLEVADEYGVVHRMWVISDPAVIQAVQAKMADKKLIIADGHHRYETALNYRNERRDGSKIDRQAPYERMMMTFVNMDSPGLLILPTHRVVFGLEDFSIFDMIKKLSQDFDVEDTGAVENVDGAVERLRAAGQEQTAVLAVTAHGGFLLRSRPGAPARSFAGMSKEQSALNVVQLHKLILEGALEMSEEDIRNQKYLKYVRDAHEAVEEVREGANVAFLINPVRMQQVREIAFGGGVLPQKSTDFYPKLLSGLTVYALE
jgi:uncharacterized protein (DUF1015 family)